MEPLTVTIQNEAAVTLAVIEVRKVGRSLPCRVTYTPAGLYDLRTAVLVNAVASAAGHRSRK